MALYSADIGINKARFLIDQLYSSNHFFYSFNWNRLRLLVHFTRLSFDMVKYILELVFSMAPHLVKVNLGNHFLSFLVLKMGLVIF